MEAIKKKMQAMKVEKDNACDRVDVCEEQCKAARVNMGFVEGDIEMVFFSHRLGPARLRMRWTSL